MIDFAQFYEARKIVAEILRADLVGPVAENEVLRESPLSYYVAGKLYPQGMEDRSLEEEAGSEADDLEDSYDSPIVMSSQRCQSSMGITFAVSENVTDVQITVHFSTYDALSEEQAAEMEYEETFLASAKRKATYLQRIPHSATTVWNAREGHQRIRIECGAEIDILPRKVGSEKAILVGVSLINANRATRDSKVTNAQKAFFQTEIKVEALGETVFLPTDFAKPLAFDEELAELEMLHLDSRAFAFGHGCSADWDMTNSTPHWVRTESLPMYAVKQMKPRTAVNQKACSMKHLSEASPRQLDTDLRELVLSYDSWIEGVSGQASSLPNQYRSLAERNVSNCKKCAERMDEGVSILLKDGMALRAFQLANRAMLLQRLRTMKVRNDQLEEETICWYPFQLGFLLMEIASFVHPECDDRDVADLLWFPTGGGKTEAYLGVAAFAMFLRRLRNPQDNGVAVIMRYTLRLLTIQQFERATALIAACEHIRREENLGGDEFSIGMYVGESLTPNTLKDAAEIVRDAKYGKLPREGQPDPFQVRKCSWCGSALNPECYEVNESTGRMFVRCPNPECEFHLGDGIPAHVVDEDIYKKLPTFLVATVDKFAQLPMKPPAAKFLGVGVAYNPPELIIQDELHLISGPLGTMVGAYETVIGELCLQNGCHPKVLTSTATARSSAHQQLALYGERSFQYPPQGISMKDSFFAVEAEPDEKPTRLYMGVMGSDSAITNVAARVSADLLFATRYLEDCGFDESVVDSFWTIVEYFNTLRELGGSLTSLLDNAQTQFRFLASTKFKERYPLSNPDKTYNNILELTSRRSSSEITSAFEDLAVGHSGGDNGDCVDFVLATNMLSVGVDIGRLGTMVVYGQPKMNSEYIQATSRVGRSTPGLVVALLNPKRSRDRSHYEQFVGFHRALYKNVESSTLTPFSDRARDRSLHTLFVTLVRYLIPGMAENERANAFRASMDGVEEIESRIVDYVQKVEPEEAESVRCELECIAEEWESRTGDGLLYYQARNPRRSLFKSDLEDDRFRVMQSMRTVEPSAQLFLDRG